jgi:hypothetical protein
MSLPASAVLDVCVFPWPEPGLRLHTRSNLAQSSKDWGGGSSVFKLVYFSPVAAAGKCLRPFDSGIRLRSCNLKNGAVTCSHLRYDQTACAGWVGFVAIDDVDATAAQIGRLGGAIFVPPTDSNIGRISVVADPQKGGICAGKGTGIWPTETGQVGRAGARGLTQVAGSRP